MSDKRYRKYADYGPEGIYPKTLHGEFDPTNNCEVPPTLDEQIKIVWSQLLEKRPRLHDSDILNLTGIADGGYTLEFGHVPFRTYYVLWLSLRNATVAREIKLTTEQRAFLQRHLHATASHLAIVSENEVLLGRKPIEGGYWIDSPGSGYLDTTHDTTHSNGICPFDQIIRREVKEELAILDLVEDINCLGVFSEETDGIAINPAVLSVARVEAPPSEILCRARGAEDSWEFEELFSVPFSDKRAIESIIVEGSVQSEVSSYLEEARYTTTPLAPKTPLLLALTGRQKYGPAWFQSIVEESGFEVTTGTIKREK
ncbi:hypothetical protein [Natronorubrum tibetense]|uniref:hypothetical protein n=1 Tax=Natronorubrum tibetense TaxID=63128 RepID=UPI00036931CC|nr:hypothetical protein [Natronorubrum tibetense]